MTQEEKAKAYDEALERAKKIHSEIVNNELIGFPGQIEDIFPELRESEDERIRKWIYSLVENLGYPADEDAKKELDEMQPLALSWLEKQKEHRETCTKFLAKILKHSAEGFRNVLKKKGIDYIPQESFWTGTAGTFSKQECNEFYKWMDDMTMELVTEETPEYKKGFKDGLDASKKERKPVEWSEDWREEDIQTRFAFYTYKDDLGVLYLSNVFVEEASRNHGFGTKILIAAEKVAETIGATTISLRVKQDSPANAWYRKRGYGYVAFEDGYDWLEKNLEYMKPNHNTLSIEQQMEAAMIAIRGGMPTKSAEWSEEDEKTIYYACYYLNEYGNHIADVNVDKSNRVYKTADALKLLRPSWKPGNNTYKTIIHNILAMLKDLDFDKIAPDHRLSLLNDIRVRCKNADEQAEILDEPSWKPSEEQMSMLLAVLNDPNNAGAESCQMALKSLYEQLKKLM